MVNKLLKRARWIAGICQKKGMVGGIKKLLNELYSSDIWHVYLLDQYDGQMLVPCNSGVVVTRVAKGDDATLKRIVEKWPVDFGIWKEQALYQMIVDRSESMPCYVIKEEQEVVGALWFDAHDNVIEALGEKLKDHQMVIRNIFIDPRCRGKGYSKLLLSGAMADMYPFGVKQFYAVAYPHKIGTEKLCLSLGYRLVFKLKEKRRLFGHSVTKINDSKAF